MIKVGPIGNSYAYRINGRLSERRYTNPQSAWFDARRTQIITDKNTIQPKGLLNVHDNNTITEWFG
jgi:hypothetical protein